MPERGYLQTVDEFFPKVSRGRMLPYSPHCPSENISRPELNPNQPTTIMKKLDPSPSRRSFIKGSSLGLALAASGNVLKGKSLKKPASPAKVKLGFDNFSIRALGWKADKLLAYAEKQKVDTILFSDLDVYESFDPGYLKELKQEGDRLGLAIQAGTGGICPTSPRENKKHGSAEEHLKLLIRVAKALGSKAARCYLGSLQDRKGEGGIKRHVDSTIAVCKKVKKHAKDAGVKIAIENHAGDLHSRELVELIERAGPDYVGATLDTGNATWTLEDPVETLENLAPFAVSSGIRDSMVWESEKGATVQWTAMGEGCVDVRKFAERWKALCPGAPVQLETISGFAKPFNYLESEFWGPYQGIRADDFSKFVSLAKKGKPIKPFKAPDGVDRKKAQQDYQLAELERSIRFCRSELGLGIKS